MTSFSALNPSLQTASNYSRDQTTNKKYQYKSGTQPKAKLTNSSARFGANKESFFDEVDESLLRGEDLADFPDAAGNPARSDVVEKFIKVIENKDSSSIQPQQLSLKPKPSVTNTKREDILKKLAGFGSEPFESSASKQQKGMYLL